MANAATAKHTRWASPCHDETACDAVHPGSAARQSRRKKASETLSKAGSESATSTPANGEPSTRPTTSRANTIVTAPVTRRSSRNTVAWCAVSAPRSLMSSRIHWYPWPSAAPTARNPTTNRICATTVAWAIRLMNLGRVMPRPWFGRSNNAMGHSPHRPRTHVSKADQKAALPLSGSALRGDTASVAGHGCVQSHPSGRWPPRHRSDPRRTDVRRDRRRPGPPPPLTTLRVRHFAASAYPWCGCGRQCGHRFL